MRGGQARLAPRGNAKLLLSCDSRAAVTRFTASHIVMSVGSLDALKVRALLERVCSVPTTLTPDELSRVCAAQLSFAEVVSLAAQLTAVIQAHEITTPAAPAAGAGRPMSARRNGNTLGAQIHAVEHLHKSLQRTARVQLANQALAAENQRLRRALFDFDGPRAASPPRAPRATELGSPRDGCSGRRTRGSAVEHPVPMLPVMGASCGVGSASLVAACSRPATAAGACGCAARGERPRRKAGDAAPRTADAARAIAAKPAAASGRRRRKRFAVPPRRCSSRAGRPAASCRCRRRRHRNLQRILRIYFASCVMMPSPP